MMKRIIWWGTGFGMGAVSSVWAKRKVRKKVDQMVPEVVRTDVGRTAKRVTSGVRTAVSEGRRAMRQYNEDAESQVNPDRPRRRLRAVSD